MRLFYCLATMLTCLQGDLLLRAMRTVGFTVKQACYALGKTPDKPMDRAYFMRMVAGEANWPPNWIEKMPASVGGWYYFYGAMSTPLPKELRFAYALRVIQKSYRRQLRMTLPVEQQEEQAS